MDEQQDFTVDPLVPPGFGVMTMAHIQPDAATGEWSALLQVAEDVTRDGGPPAPVEDPGPPTTRAKAVEHLVGLSETVSGEYNASEAEDDADRERTRAALRLLGVTDDEMPMFGA